MKTIAIVCGTLACIVSIFFRSSSLAAETQPPVDPAKFHALLVGCTTYDNLPSKSLVGPANDVELMRRFLTEQLKLSPTSITVLSEAEKDAHQNSQPENYRPTRANIEREIGNLIQAAQEGDQVLLLLCGHGGQQPEQKQTDPNYLKPDGLDQMFLPCDCGQWDGTKLCVNNAIVDYELRDWCKQITKKKARLWVILDCCCSGWTMRGKSEEVARSVSTNDLGIPDSAVQAARCAAAARQPASRGVGEPTRGAGTAEMAVDFGPPSPDYVGLYAAQRDESELEMPMPRDVSKPGRKNQGLLTYAIVDILSRASRPITYGELANLVRERYPQWGCSTYPTPVVEGLAQAEDRQVLGVQRWAGRSSRRWQKEGSNYFTVNEGSVQGLTPESIVALHPSIDQPDSETVLGYATVQDCDLLSSTIKLTKYNGVSAPRPATLPDSGSFEIAWSDCGSMRIKVGIDPQPAWTNSAAEKTAGGTVPAAGDLENLATALKKAFSSEGSLCEFVDNVQAAQWVVQSRDGKFVLLAKDTAEIRGKLPDEAARFSISDADPAAAIGSEMSSIARAQNLLNLTGQPVNGTAGVKLTHDASQPNIELKILKFQSKADQQPTELDLTKGPLTLVSGDWVGWQMINHGPADVAVSLLYVDAGYGIQAVFPRPGSGVENMLTRNGGVFTTITARITANPAGNEHVVLIAVPRKPGHQSPDFSFLQQKTLPAARGIGDPTTEVLESPLGRLLKNAMYGEGGTRGWEPTDAAEAQLTLRSWRVAADK